MAVPFRTDSGRSQVMTEPSDEYPEPPDDGVIEAELDKGVPHDRTLHGGSPPVDDDLLEHLAEEDRVAAGLEDFDPDNVPSAEE
jgi:hypothetical protein